MKDNLTDITFILDRSTSMGAIKPSTISGFNEFLKSQQEAEGDANFSLIQFDSAYEVMYSGININEAVALTDKTFQPRGMTALLDAIGRTIDATGVRLSLLPEKDRPAKVIFVILTDGEENTSQEYSSKKIKEMIKHQTDVYDWDFIFLAANQDAITAGGAMGFEAGNSMTFAANVVGSTALYSSVGDKMSLYRSGAVAKGAFFDADDRDKQTQAGA
jgi:hypothetical protein